MRKPYEIISVIQARTGSTRLPGKVMYPLAGEPSLEHVVRRVDAADLVDDVVVATSTKSPDDVIATYAPEFGAEVVRGSEEDVLGRFGTAVDEYQPDVIVRVTGDCPLIHPEVIDAVVSRLRDTDADYATNIIDRTFPRGLDFEAFTAEAFEILRTEATTSRHREHVTPYFREQSERFDTVNVTSERVFGEAQFQDRSDLRLTLDEPNDYRLLDRIYENVPFDNILPIRDAIRYVDEHDLIELNANVEQKTH